MVTKMRKIVNELHTHTHTHTQDSSINIKKEIKRDDYVQLYIG